jgi:hypothetical protein
VTTKRRVMKQLNIRRYFTLVKLAAEVYVSSQCFVLLQELTGEGLFAFLASLILFGLGRVPEATRSLGINQLQRFAYSSVHWFILVGVEALSAFILFTRNQARLLDMFGPRVSAMNVYFGLWLLLISFKIAVELLPGHLGKSLLLFADVHFVVPRRQNMSYSFAIEEGLCVTARFQLWISGTTRNDIGALILKGDGSVESMLGRISNHGEWRIRLAPGQYTVQLCNKFSLSSKRVRLRIVGYTKSYN